jgi:hypothetical protein
MTFKAIHTLREAWMKIELVRDEAERVWLVA